MRSEMSSGHEEDDERRQRRNHGEMACRRAKTLRSRKTYERVLTIFEGYHRPLDLVLIHSTTTDQFLPGWDQIRIDFQRPSRYTPLFLRECRLSESYIESNNRRVRAGT